MKNNSVKILLVILAFIQAGLGLKFIVIIRPLFIKGSVPNFILADKVIVVSVFIISMIFTIVALLLALSKSKSLDNTFLDITIKNELKDKSEQKKLVEEDKRQIQLQKERKLIIINELSKDLILNEGIQKYSEKVLINISKQFNIMQGLFYLKDLNDKVYRKVGTYAYYSQEDLREFTDDIGLSGQVASNKKLLNISNIPDKYITVHSGLGKSAPANLIIFPILYRDESIGIVELASFVKFDSFTEEILMEYSLIIGNQLYNLDIEKVI